MSAPIPHNEPARLEALYRYAILDTAAEAAFDDLTRLAAHTCGTPIALISLTDANRQWFKSRLGVEALERPRDSTFSAYGILQEDVLIVPDASADPRFAKNALVAGAPHIRFYAGVRLVTPDGYALGMLCVKDYVPRTPTGEQVEALRIVGRQVMAQLELRNQTAKLNMALVGCQRGEAALRQSQHLFQTVIDHLPQRIFWKDQDLAYLGCNQLFAQDAGMEAPACLVGKTDFDMPWLPQAEAYRADDRQVMDTMIPKLNFEEPIEKAGRTQAWLRTSKIPLLGLDNIIVVGMYEDVTETKANEAERIRLQDEIIRAQEAALSELSTPLIPISEQIVVMPIIGTVDTGRAQQVLQTLLTGVDLHHAAFVILDITGVPVVDTQVANALLHAAQAVKLLGAQVVLTGIRPEVAQTVVQLGIDLRHLVTRSTLQAGIEYALTRSKF